MESWINNKNVTAVIMAHLPGQESGNALVDILFGDVNPSGKLPYTIAKLETDYPARVLYKTRFLDFTPQVKRRFFAKCTDQ
jgi:beta-glucosidase